MADYERWGHGGVDYPLADDSDQALLEDADPALYWALEFLSNVLEIEVGPRLVAQAEREGLKLPRAVRKVISIEPAPVLNHEQFEFPLLAIYRKSEQQLEHTVVYEKDVAVWEFAYVLPSLTPRQQVQLAPILRPVARVVGHAISQGYHPGYRDGLLVWKAAGIQSARLVSVTYGGYERVDELANSGFYRAVVGTIEVVERDRMPDDAFEPFEGATATIDVAENGTTVEAVAVVATEPPPTVTTIIPNAGPKTGGTAVTIKGTRFRDGAAARLGGAPLVDVLVVDDETITGVTTAHAAYPSTIVDVVVTNDDGQSGTLAAGFTFTTP